MFAIPKLSAPRAVRVDTAPVAFLRARLGTSRFFTLGPFQPNCGSYFGIASLNANDVPAPSGFAQYVKWRLDQVVDPTGLVGNYGGGRPVFAPSPTQELLINVEGYREAAVAYVLTPAGQQLPPENGTFTLVFRSPSTWIYKLAGAAPYFSAKPCAISAAGRDSARVVCTRQTTLVRRETYLPGWSATIDGHDAPVRGAGVFQAVTVPAGAHRVSFSYQPPNVGWGYLAFALGVTWLLLPFATSRVQTLRTRSPA